MENFLSEPDYNEIRNNIIALTQKEEVLICTNSFDVDSLTLSSLVMKYSSGYTFISFSSSEQCDLVLRNETAGRWIEVQSKKYFVGKTSFSSFFSLSVNDLLSILTGVMTSAVQERRQLSEIEKNLIMNSQSLGVTIENNLKIPNYKQLPLSISLMLSLDPYLPDISGNRVNAIKLVKELGGDEALKLEDLNETQLNTLMFRILGSMSKYTQATRDDVIASRIFYMEYDLLEMVFVSLYELDVHGAGKIIEMVFNPSFAEVMVDEFRSNAIKGFSFNVKEGKSIYKVETSLMSPQLAHLVILQQKMKNKPVVVVQGDKKFSSKFFFPELDGKGLAQVDGVD